MIKKKNSNEIRSFLFFCRIRHLLKLQVQAQPQPIRRPNWVHFVECWMRSGTALQNVAERKNRIGYWISSHIVRVRRVYHRRMCHQMHQQQIYYAVTCQLIRPCHHIIGYACKCVKHILFDNIFVAVAESVFFLFSLCFDRWYVGVCFGFFSLSSCSTRRYPHATCHQQTCTHSFVFDVWHNKQQKSD